MGQPDVHNWLAWAEAVRLERVMDMASAVSMAQDPKECKRAMGKIRESIVAIRECWTEEQMIEHRRSKFYKAIRSRDASPKG